MSKPFDVELDVGGSVPVSFKLYEDTIRERRDVRIAAAIGDDGGDPDDRTRLWRGAVELVHSVLDDDAPELVRIFTGPDVWILRKSTIRTIRLHDPDSPDRKTHGIGFRREADDES